MGVPNTYHRRRQHRGLPTRSCRRRGLRAHRRTRGRGGHRQRRTALAVRPGVPFLYPPAATGRVVYIRSEGSKGGYLDALDASTGVRRWRYKGAWSSTPAVFGDQVYVGCFGGEIHAVDAIAGDRVRTYSTGSGYITLLTASDEFVYVASIEGVHTLRPEP